MKERKPFSKITLPPKYAALPLLTQLWLQSRLVAPEDDPKFRKAGYPRPLNKANVLIAVDILRIVVPRLWADTNRQQKLRWAIHLLYIVLKGVIPVVG